MNISLIPFFSDINLSNNQIDTLGIATKVVKYDRGETLYKQNTSSPYLIWLKGGLLKITIEGNQNRDHILDFVVPVDFFGLTMLSSNSPLLYSVKVLTNSSVHLIEKKAFNKVLNESIELNKWFRKEIDLVCQKFTSKVFFFRGSIQLHGRLADTILSFDKPRLANRDIYKYISKKEIAEYTGMSSESLVRLLNELKNDKIISINGRRIIINLRKDLA